MIEYITIVTVATAVLIAAGILVSAEKNLKTERGKLVEKITHHRKELARLRKKLNDLNNQIV